MSIHFTTNEWTDGGFKPATKEEIENNRISAYLSFDEEDIANEFNGYTHKYKNLKGNYLKCYILLERDNGQIVVRNENGVNCCLTKERLIDVEGE